MLTVGIRDVVYCSQGSHMVPRAEISKLYADDGKTSRVCCVTCKEAALERRAKAKK